MGPPTETDGGLDSFDRPLDSFDGRPRGAQAGRQVVRARRQVVHRGPSIRNPDGPSLSAQAPRRPLGGLEPVVGGVKSGLRVARVTSGRPRGVPARPREPGFARRAPCRRRLRGVWTPLLTRRHGHDRALFGTRHGSLRLRRPFELRASPRARSRARVVVPTTPDAVFPCIGGDEMQATFRSLVGSPDASACATRPRCTKPAPRTGRASCSLRGGCACVSTEARRSESPTSGGSAALEGSAKLDDIDERRCGRARVHRRAQREMTGRREKGPGDPGGVRAHPVRVAPASHGVVSKRAHPRAFARNGV